MDNPGSWIAVGVAVIAAVYYLAKRTGGRATATPVVQRPIISPPSRSPSSPSRGRSAECEAIRQRLRLPLMYDEEKIDRLVAFERQRLSGATEEQLHLAAYERWVQDNR
jgi:hypothetical protein